MDGQNYVVFHNAADDSYMNTTANFRGAYANTETVDIYFKAAAVGNAGSSAGYDKIVVACTNGEEDRAVEQLAAVMAGSINPVTIVADDVNTKYACPDITSVTSITMSVMGNIKNVIPATFSTADTGGVDNRIIATNSNSGSVFTVNAGTDASSTIYLPDAPVTGWNARFVCNHPSDAHTITITENGESTPFSGIANSGGDIDALTGSASVVLAASDYKLGDWFECRWDGTIWLFNGQFQTDASVSAS
jgi:hypothetical protein